jgi:hypothetical protein
MIMRTHSHVCPLENVSAKGGVSPISEHDFDKRYVQPVDELKYSYLAKRSTWDSHTRTLTEPALRWVQHAPVFHDHVDEWFRALGGSTYERLAQWLASCVTLDRPAPALFIIGPKHIGKDLLATGLAKLYGSDAPAEMRESASDFNEALAHMPLVVANEALPERFNFATLREDVTRHSRRVNVKHKPKFSVEGCCRYLITLNQADVLRYVKTGVLTRDSIDAVLDRLAVIQASTDAAQVLARLTEQQRTAMADREIAEHVCYLAQTVPLDESSRMASVPGGGELILTAHVAAQHAKVLRLLALVLAGSASSHSGVLQQPGAVLVNRKMLADHARSVAPFGESISEDAIGDCCAAFTGGTVVKMRRPGAVRREAAINWRRLDAARVHAAIARCTDVELVAATPEGDDAEEHF